MTTLAKANTDQLAALIAAKLQLVEILGRLGRQQLALIDASDMTGLVKLLAAKQTVLAQLQLVERQLDPFRNEDPDQRRWPTATQREQCQSQAERCNTLLAEAIELEKQGEAAMVRRRDATAAVLASAQTASEARSAYASGTDIGPLNLQVEG